MYAADPGDGRNVISIRGITSTSYDPAVVTYIDGVPQFTLDTYIPQLFDVDHIDVLKGPQGTLYGRNALGGVINIITKKPDNQLHASLKPVWAIMDCSVILFNLVFHWLTENFFSALPGFMKGPMGTIPTTTITVILTSSIALRTTST